MVTLHYLWLKPEVHRFLFSCVFVYSYALLKTTRKQTHFVVCLSIYRVTQKRELLKNPTKMEEIQEKKLLTEIEPLKLAF